MYAIRLSSTERVLRRTMSALACTVALGVFGASESQATPEPATWLRQVLIGENPTRFFRYVTIHDHPGTHYAYSETLRVQAVRKTDLRVAEDSLVRVTDYSQDYETRVWSTHEEPTPPFDLGGYLRRHGVFLAFAESMARRFEIDTTGVLEVFEDGRVELLSRADLNRQIPDLGEEPRVVGIEWTQMTLPDGSTAFYYLRIQSNTAAVDDYWSERLAIVPGARLH